MKTTNGWPSYSGYGPNNFNKRQLLEIVSMRKSAGKSPRKNLSINTLDATPRETLVREAKRLRKPFSWSHYANQARVMKHAS